MEYTINIKKEDWYEPLYNEVITVCEYLLTYIPSKNNRIIPGDNLLIGNNTEIVIFETVYKYISYITAKVYSKEPYDMKYIILKVTINDKIKFIIDTNKYLESAFPYGSNWYNIWKETKAPIWITMEKVRELIKTYLIQLHGVEFISELDLEDYLTYENNFLYTIPYKKSFDKYNTIKWNIRDSCLEDFFVISHPLQDEL